MAEDTTKETSPLDPLEQRYKVHFRYTKLGLVCLLIIGLLSGYTFWQVNADKDAAVSNSQAQAELTKQSDICKVYPDQELCILARKIADNPTTPAIPKDGKDGQTGATGAQGPAGRGVATFNTNVNGDLIVQYSDGQTENVGHVVGKDGKDGAAGKDGRGILSSSIEAGSLIIHYSDGTSSNLGIVVGPQGQTGATGSPGVDGKNGVDGKDGATGAQGIQGPAGRGVQDIQITNVGDVVVYYTDNTSAIAGRVIINTIKSMNCDKNTDILTITMIDGTQFSTSVDCTPDTINVPKPVATSSTVTGVIK